MCCRIGIDSGSFMRAAGSLERVGQLKISDELMRQMAEDVHLFKASQIVAVTDGALWIQGVIEDCLPEEKTTAILALESLHQAISGKPTGIQGPRPPPKELADPWLY